MITMSSGTMIRQMTTRMTLRVTAAAAVVAIPATDALGCAISEESSHETLVIPLHSPVSLYIRPSAAPAPGIRHVERQIMALFISRPVLIASAVAVVGVLCAGSAAVASAQPSSSLVSSSSTSTPSEAPEDSTVPTPQPSIFDDPAMDDLNDVDGVHAPGTHNDVADDEVADEAEDNEAEDNEAEDNEAEDNEADVYEAKDNEADVYEAEDTEAEDSEADDSDSHDNDSEDNDNDSGHGSDDD